jgi:hypothetical protein
MGVGQSTTSTSRQGKDGAIDNTNPDENSKGGHDRSSHHRQRISLAKVLPDLWIGKRTDKGTVCPCAAQPDRNKGKSLA